MKIHQSLDEILAPIIEELVEVILVKLDGVPEPEWREFIFHNVIHGVTERIRDHLTAACIDLL